MSTVEIRASDTSSANKTYLLIAGIVVLLAAYIPSLIQHFQILWSSEQYQYFPFVIGAVAWLGWTRWNEATPLPATQERSSFVWNQLPLICLLFAIFSLALGIYCQWGWFAAVSLNFLAAAGLLVLNRKYHICNGWGIWCLLWLLVPPPIEFGANVVQRLQLASSLMGSQILDLLGVDHLMSGNTFTVPTIVSTEAMATELGKALDTPVTRDLFVDEACSGIISVMSIIAATGIYAVWKDRSLVHSGLLMLSSVAWALIMNTIRLVVIAIAETRFQVDLASGAAHECLGLLLFSCTFVASMSTDQLLEFLLGPISEQGGDLSIRGNPLVRLWNWGCNLMSPEYREGESARSLGDFTAAVLTQRNLLLGSPLVALAAWSVASSLGVVGERPSSVSPEVVYSSVSEDTLPAEFGNWKLTSYEARKRKSGWTGNYDYGTHSNAYTYESDDLTAQVSMDFPFSGGWHELTVCYDVGVGDWEITSRKAVTDIERVHVESEFQNESGYGFLVFNNFNDRGKLVTPASEAILTRTWLFLRRRLLREISPDLYQVQVFAASAEPLTEEQKGELRALFFEVEKRFTAQVEKLAGSS